MNVKPIPAATTYAISSTNGAADGNSRREENEKEKKPKFPEAKSVEEAKPTEPAAPAPSSLSQMVDSEKVVELLGRRPSAKNRAAFVKTMAPGPSRTAVIDVKKLDKSF